MSDKNKDVLIAAYLFEDLAKQDFDAVLKLAEQKMITVEGVVLVQKDAGGELHVTETGDHLGRKGATIGGASASSSASSHRHCWPRPRSERPPAPSWQVRQTPAGERHRRENGRSFAARLGRRDRRLRH
jgi:hypothetical protein